jgi:hypothetical protein
MFDVRVYWGNPQDFIADIEKIWSEFKNKNNLNAYPPARGM